MTTELTYTQLGTPAFPVYAVYRDYTDSEGFLQEHLSQHLASFPNKAAAEAYIKQQSK